MKLLRFHMQEEEIKRLKEELFTQREVQKEYAREYNLMRNKYITEAKDAQAALRNFDKAMKLYSTFVDAWMRKGGTLLDTGDYYAAQTCFLLKPVTTEENTLSCSNITKRLLLIWIKLSPSKIITLLHMNTLPKRIVARAMKKWPNTTNIKQTD
jgi:hypothetical protein